MFAGITSHRSPRSQKHLIPRSRVLGQWSHPQSQPPAPTYSIHPTPHTPAEIGLHVHVLYTCMERSADQYISTQNTIPVYMCKQTFLKTIESGSPGALWYVSQNFVSFFPPLRHFLVMIALMTRVACHTSC